MNWYCALLALFALLAGVYFGVQDFKADRAALVGDRATVPRPSDPGAEKPGDPAQAEAPDSAPEPEPIELDRAALEKAAGGAIAEARGRVKQGRFDAASKALTAALARSVKKHREGLQAEPDSVALLDDLRRESLRIELFLSIVKGAGSASIPDQLYLVRLKNGNEMTASRADLEGDRYSVVLFPLEITFTKPKSEIAEVVGISAKNFVGREWEQLARKLEAVADPIDLYVKGVGRCLKLGLQREAYDLLQRVLDAEDAADVVEIVLADSEGEFKRRWRQVSGETPLDLIPELIPEVAVARPSLPSEPIPTRPFTPSSPSRPDRPASPNVSHDFLVSSFRDVQKLGKEARKIYRDAISSGDLKTLAAAREKLERARQILSTLPQENEEVKSKKSNVFELLHAVIKAQPF